MRAPVLLLAIALAVGPVAGCKREEQPTVAVAAPLRISPVVEDHPWVIAFLTELSIKQLPGTDVRLEGRTFDHDGYDAPEPVFEADDPKVVTNALREFERLHPSPPELTPVWERQLGQRDPHHARLVWKLHFIDTQAGFVVSGGASATLEPKPDRTFVRVQLSAQQREQFTSLTRAQVGRKIAFTIDDSAIMVPIVNEPIPGGEVWLVPEQLGDDPDAAAKRLLERLAQPQ